MQKIFYLFLLFQILFVSLSTAQEKQYKLAAIGFYNVENLFDTVNDTLINDEEYLPDGDRQWTEERYNEKITNLATVVTQLATEKTRDGIAILGVSEVENRKVLEDFVAHPFLKDRNYQIVHYDSPDRRGIDVGLIYQPKYFEVTASKAIPLKLYEDDSTRIYTRDVLLVSGIFDSEPLHIFVNHWPSRRGGESRSGLLRAAGAMACRSAIDSLQQIDPNAKVIVMGDLNDDPNSPSLKKVLEAKSKIKHVKPGGLFNPMYDFYKKGIGSNAYRDAWSLFDQVIVSHSLLDKKQEGYFYHKAVIYNKKFLVQKSGAFKGYPFRTFGGSKYAGGYSDHFPVYVYLIKEVTKTSKLPSILK